MIEYRTKLGNNGRILIPAAFRRLMHLEPGETLILRIEKNELHLLSLKHSLKKAQTVVARYAKNVNLVEKLNAMRHEDSQHE